MQDNSVPAKLVLVAGLLFIVISSVAVLSPARGIETAGQKPLNPNAWGKDHVGRPVPEYVSGDECLFCHRNDIGPGWSKNRHSLTVRQREDAPELAKLLRDQKALAGVDSEITYFMGSAGHIRFLKKIGYGKFALLSARADLDADGHVQKLVNAEKPTWDKEIFANRCAGCHTTAVDSSAKTFAAFGLDCYTCHGVVDLDHTKDTSLIWLSKKRRSDAQAITSICAQCHLRGSKSRSTGLPYPNNFVVGDNLFKDFQVDLSKADDESLNAGDRHIFRNVRDVVLSGSDFPTCINCHDVHKHSNIKHRRAPRTAVCNDCHNAQGPIKGSKAYAMHSPLCDY
jgi:hypothetical protein